MATLQETVIEDWLHQKCNLDSHTAPIDEETSCWYLAREENKKPENSADL